MFAHKINQLRWIVCFINKCTQSGSSQVYIRPKRLIHGTYHRPVYLILHRYIIFYTHAYIILHQNHIVSAQIEYTKYSFFRLFFSLSFVQFTPRFVCLHYGNTLFRRCCCCFPFQFGYFPREFSISILNIIDDIISVSVIVWCMCVSASLVYFYFLLSDSRL